MGVMPDHVHILISIPPKYSVSEVIGYLKGKSSIWIAQNVERRLRNFLGQSQILGVGLLRFDRRAGRRDDPRLYQESSRQAAGADATEARILIKSDPLSQHPS